jgi:hypothetical protein
MMAFSWLQKRQVKVVARGSRYGSKGLALLMMKYGKGKERLTDGFGILFLGPAACVMTSCVFPTEQCQTTVICKDEEGMLLDAPSLQTTVVDKGVQGRNFVRSLLI